MPITIVCAWCGRPMGTKPGHADLPVSHSICPDCARKLCAETDQSQQTKSKEEDR